MIFLSSPRKHDLEHIIRLTIFSNPASADEVID